MISSHRMEKKTANMIVRAPDALVQMYRMVTKMPSPSRMKKVNPGSPCNALRLVPSKPHLKDKTLPPRSSRFSKPFVRKASTLQSFSMHLVGVTLSAIPMRRSNLCELDFLSVKSCLAYLCDDIDHLRTIIRGSNQLVHGMCFTILPFRSQMNS